MSLLKEKELTAAIVAERLRREWIVRKAERMPAAVLAELWPGLWKLFGEIEPAVVPVQWEIRTLTRFNWDCIVCADGVQHPPQMAMMYFDAQGRSVGTACLSHPAMPGTFAADEYRKRLR